jgi:hypothetical protein
MAEFAQSREYPALEFCFTKYRAGQSTIGQVASFTLHSIPLRAAGTEQDKVQQARALHERLFKATITMQGETRTKRSDLTTEGSRDEECDRKCLKNFD